MPALRSLFSLFAAAMILMTAAPMHATPTIDRLSSECVTALKSRRYREMVSLGTRLEREAAHEGLRASVSLGAAMRLRGELLLQSGGDHLQTAKRLEEDPLLLTDTLSNLPTRYFLLAAIALYHHFEGLDYSKAADYAYEALSVAKKIPDKALQADALCLLSSIYFLKGDPGAWQYAVKCQQIASRSDNPSAAYGANINMALYLFGQDKAAEAMKYTLLADSIAKRNGMGSEHSYIHTLLGDLHASLGNSKDAEANYRLALEHHPDVSKYDSGWARLRYGQYLASNGRFAESVTELRRVEEETDPQNPPNYYPDLLYCLASSLENLGLPSEALATYKNFLSVNQALITSDREKEVSRLEMKYHVSEMKEENMRQALELSEKKRNIQILSAATLLAILAVTFLTVFHRRTRAYYRGIVRTRTEALEKETRLLDNMRQMLAARQAEGNDSSLAPHKADHLFQLLSERMATERLYTQPDLSIEKLAAILGTNRTYLSRVINERIGTSYPQYINDLRINYAIELLKNPSVTDSLKEIGFRVGFATIANFNSIFKKKVGISPGTFRKNMPVETPEAAQ